VSSREAGAPSGVAYPGSSLLEIAVERWNRETRRLGDRLYK
jgi:hypothetical protein